VRARGGAPVTSLAVVVVGPTATGKSDLALALAERLGAEIVNADAMQLYRGMDIGTAKVSSEDRRGVPHHQLDVLDLSDDASVAAYQREARADIAAIQERGRRVVVVGGSGLYVRALIDELDFPGTDPAVRAALETRAVAEGAAALHAELEARDPAAAIAIPASNPRRVVRALEVIELTGRPFSATMPTYTYAVPAVQLGLTMPLEDLDARIDARVHRMWSAGLIAEVSELARRGLRDGRTASRAVGYAEVLAFLNGDVSEETARHAVLTNTRRLARRQLTWFRRDPRVTWLDARDEGLIERVSAVISAADLAVAG
jgi:tRNA dimethylallyltransferase